MPEKTFINPDEPFNLEFVRDELGRVPVMGRESDRELFVDLPSAGLSPPHVAEVRAPVQRELLANEFLHGF